MTSVVNERSRSPLNAPKSKESDTLVVAADGVDAAVFFDWGWFDGFIGSKGMSAPSEIRCWLIGAVLQRWCCRNTEIYDHLAQAASDVLYGIHGKANNLCPFVYSVASSQWTVQRCTASLAVVAFVTS